MNRSERLKQTRLNLGLSHIGLAERIGLSHTTLEKLQSDETAWLTIKKETSDKIEAFYESINTKSSEVVQASSAVVTNLSNVTSKDEKALTLIEFIYENLSESKSHSEFMANINMLKRVVDNY